MPPLPPSDLVQNSTTQLGEKQDSWEIHFRTQPSHTRRQSNLFDGCKTSDLPDLANDCRVVQKVRSQVTDNHRQRHNSGVSSSSAEFSLKGANHVRATDGRTADATTASTQSGTPKNSDSNGRVQLKLAQILKAEDAITTFKRQLKEKRMVYSELLDKEKTDQPSNFSENVPL